MLLSGGVNIGVIIAIVVVVLLVLIFLGRGVKVVRQTEKLIIERFGAYHKTLDVGIHFIWPIIDKVAKKVNMKEQVRDYDPQSVITKDNVTMQIDTVIFFQITDAKLYVYGVENPGAAIENLSATTLRNIIGELDLDETLTSRDIINVKMREILDDATDAWGIKVNRVEVKNILPPKDIRDAMEKQMRAERERREKILQAEGEKEQMIKLAQGRAEAVKVEKEAEALGIKLVKEAGADQAVLALKGMEALAKVADGKATKIIVPSEIQNLSGVLAAAKATVESDKETK